MKIFAIYAKPILTERPEWFDDFYDSYGGGYDLHITLKQSCFIDEKDEQDVKNKLFSLFNSLQTPNHRMHLTLDTLVVPETGCIMINAREYAALHRLQKKILSVLKGYNQYTAPELQEYEKNFIPHITIAQDVALVKKESLETLKSHCLFKAIIQDIACIFLKEATLEEANNPKNRTMYLL